MNAHVLNKLYTDKQTVSVVFVNTEYAPGHEQHYTYLVPDGLQPKQGDFGIVYANDKYSVVVITAVHETSQVDPKATYQYKWIIGLVDPSDYWDILEKEKRYLHDTRQTQPSRV